MCAIACFFFGSKYETIAESESNLKGKVRDLGSDLEKINVLSKTQVRNTLITYVLPTFVLHTCDRKPILRS